MKALLVAFLSLSGCFFLDAPEGCSEENRSCPEGKTCIPIATRGVGGALWQCLTLEQVQAVPARAIGVAPSDREALTSQQAPPLAAGGTARKWFGVLPAVQSPPQGTTGRWCDRSKCTLGPSVRDISKHTDVREMGSQYFGDIPEMARKFSSGWGCLYACGCGYNEHVPERCPGQAERGN